MLYLKQHIVMHIISNALIPIIKQIIIISYAPLKISTIFPLFTISIFHSRIIILNINIIYRIHAKNTCMKLIAVSWMSCSATLIVFSQRLSSSAWESYFSTFCRLSSTNEAILSLYLTTASPIRGCAWY